MMKKIFLLMLCAAMLCVAMTLFGCSGAQGGAETANTTDENTEADSMDSSKTDNNAINIDGTDISKYVIAYREYVSDDDVVSKAKGLTETLKNDIFEKFGVELRIITERQLIDSTKYILVTADSTNVSDWSVISENGNISISGSYASVDRALEAFVNEFLVADDTGRIDSKNLEGKLEYTVPYTKADMLELFEEVYEDDERVISGCHTYGHGNGSDIKNTDNEFLEKTGKRAAILELDMGVYSVYTPWHKGSDHLDDETLSRIASEALEFVSDGGIVSVCIHMANPLMNASDNVFYRGRLGDDAAAREMLTDGTELNNGLRKTLEPTIRLLEVLRDNGIPFMFRPLHEMNGGWFWWCVHQGDGNMLSSETMVDFWKFFYGLVTEDLGIDNAVWVYSPNYNGGGCADVLYAYPGDEYVDIVGVDWYTGGNYEVNSDDSYTKVMSTGKPSALTEFGPTEAAMAEGYNSAALLRDMKMMIDDGYKLTYFLTWAGTMSAVQLGEGDILMNDKMVMTVEDLAEYWNK